jgi:hypothetical protein
MITESTSARASPSLRPGTRSSRSPANPSPSPGLTHREHQRDPLGQEAARYERNGRELSGTGVLLLSQYVEERYVMELLADGVEGVGYLLKDRVAEVDRFTDAVRRVASGGSALDPEVVAQIVDPAPPTHAALRADSAGVPSPCADGGRAETARSPRSSQSPSAPSSAT